MKDTVFTATFEPGYTPPAALVEALADMVNCAARQVKNQVLYDELSEHLSQEREALAMMKATMCTEPTLADTRQHIAACELVLAWLVHDTKCAAALSRY